MRQGWWRQEGCGRLGQGWLVLGWVWISFGCALAEKCSAAGVEVQGGRTAACIAWSRLSLAADTGG